MMLRNEQNLLIDRDLAWLEFNRRVLKEAKDPTVPLLERVKFLAIFSPISMNFSWSGWPA